MHWLMSELAKLPLEVRAAHANKTLIHQYNTSQVVPRTKYGSVVFEIHIKKDERTEVIRKRIQQLILDAHEKSPFPKVLDSVSGTFYSGRNIAVSHEKYRETESEPELVVSLSWEKAHQITFLREAMERFKIQQWKPAPAIGPDEALQRIRRLLPEGLRDQAPTKRARRTGPIEDELDSPKKMD